MYAYQMPFNLIERSPRELIVLEVPTADIFTFDNSEFKVLFSANQKISKEKIKSLIQEGVKTVFVSQEDNELIEQRLISKLRANSRSLSIGDTYTNTLKHLSLMTMNLQNLYNSPLNDEILKLLFQSSSNLVGFLTEHKKIVNQLYKNISNEPFHYSKLQPLLSSLLLLGFCHYIRLFSNRETENLFVTSYFKDLGMCYLSEDTLDKEFLAPHEKNALKVHPYNTLLLLENRVPINKTSLEIITHHHFLNDQIDQVKSGGKTNQDEDIAYGIETYLVSAFDIIAAMINKRPYRDKATLFETLELIKGVMADQYPLEFKALVHYLKFFFKD